MANSKVLLHTWSLSVEEQFYLVFPLLLILLRRHPRGLVAAIAVLFCTSLLACILVTPISSTAAFFLFPFRAWELLLGVLLAIAAFEFNLSGRYGPIMTWAGVSGVGLSILLLTSGDNFPGAAALLPTVSAALIILNIRDPNVPNRLLAWRPLVFVGLISYSLYLWHWPVLTLSNYYRDGSATDGESLAWLAGAFALAILSWRFVERPVREATALPPLRVAMAAATVSAVLLVAGGLAYRSDGMPDPFPPEIRSHIEASADFIQDWSGCSVAADGPLQASQPLSGKFSE